MPENLEELPKPKGLVARCLWSCVWFYKKAISPVIHFFNIGGCRFYPTCSIYSMQAFARHGAIKGLILTLCRILRCQPFCSGGFDYVPKEFKLSRLFKQNKVDEWRELDN